MGLETPEEDGTAERGASWIVDEEASSRHLIRVMLALSPTQRLTSLRNFYRLYLVGQRRLGRDPQPGPDL